MGDRSQVQLQVGGILVSGSQLCVHTSVSGVVAGGEDAAPTVAASLTVPEQVVEPEGEARHQQGAMATEKGRHQPGSPLSTGQTWRGRDIAQLGPCLIMSQGTPLGTRRTGVVVHMLAKPMCWTCALLWLSLRSGAQFAFSTHL